MKQTEKRMSGFKLGKGEIMPYGKKASEKARGNKVIDKKGK